jgi:hypothetical protein
VAKGAVGDPAAQALGAVRAARIGVRKGDEQLLAADARQEVAGAQLGPQTLAQAGAGPRPPRHGRTGR